MKSERTEHMQENLQAAAREKAGDGPCRLPQSIWVYSEAVREPLTFLTGAKKIRC